MSFDILFTPLKINGMTVKNRLVVPAMGTNFANEDNTISRRLIDYHVEKARGGFGLIILEVTAVDPLAPSIRRQPGIWDDRFLPGLKELVDAVHAEGAKFCIQLHHAGRQTHKSFLHGGTPVAPSPMPCPTCLEVVHELTTDEVYALIDKFIAAGIRAKKAGADAVEVHGAHGYLIWQFMSPFFNARNDEFGGTLGNRMRFPTLIVEGLRKELGPDFPILFRLNAQDGTPGGVGLSEARVMAGMLEDCGVDALNVSTANYKLLGPSCEVSGSVQGPLVDAAESIKRSVRIPVIAVNRILEPQMAANLIKTGKADLIALGRTSLADPHYPNKIREGRLDEICPCIGCHQGCLDALDDQHDGIGCVLNPFTGREGSRKLLPAEKKKKVLVAGAGPAGLLCAWLLAARGHSVDLYEKSSHIGGQFRTAAFPPCKAELSKPIRYYHYMGQKTGVRLHRETEVTRQMILDQKPDVVVLATGGQPLLPPIEGIHDTGAVIASDVLEGRVVLSNKKVLVAGGGMVGVETADFLCMYDNHVTIVEMRPQIAADITGANGYYLKERLRRCGTIGIAGARIKQFISGGIIYEKEGKDLELSGFDAVILALGARAFNPLEKEISDIVPELFVIGDAVKAGKIQAATSSAADVALKI